MSSNEEDYSDNDFSGMDCDDNISSSNSSNFSDDDCSDVVRKITNMNQPSRITFKLRVTENTSSIWETVSIFFLNLMNFNFIFNIMSRVMTHPKRVVVVKISDCTRQSRKSGLNIN